MIELIAAITGAVVGMTTLAVDMTQTVWDRWRDNEIEYPAQKENFDWIDERF